LVTREGVLVRTVIDLWEKKICCLFYMSKREILWYYSTYSIGEGSSRRRLSRASTFGLAHKVSAVADNGNLFLD
jgi:hypothetical protein